MPAVPPEPGWTFARSHQLHLPWAASRLRGAEHGGSGAIELEMLKEPAGHQHCRPQHLSFCPRTTSPGDGSAHASALFNPAFADLVTPDLMSRLEKIALAGNLGLVRRADVLPGLSKEREKSVCAEPASPQAAALPGERSSVPQGTAAPASPLLTQDVPPPISSPPAARLTESLAFFPVTDKPLKIVHELLVLLKISWSFLVYEVWVVFWDGAPHLHH